MNRQEVSTLFGSVEAYSFVPSVTSSTAFGYDLDLDQRPAVVSSTDLQDMAAKAPKIVVAKKASAVKRGKTDSATKKALAKKKKSGRPLTGYNHFFRHQREHVAKLRRELSARPDCPSIAKLISMKWKELSPSERAYYDTLAAEEKLRQYNEKQGWVYYNEDQAKQSEPTPVVEEEIAPLAIESMRSFERELDSECLGILFRALA